MDCSGDLLIRGLTLGVSHIKPDTFAEHQAEPRFVSDKIFLILFLFRREELPVFQIFFQNLCVCSSKLYILINCHGYCKTLAYNYILLYKFNTEMNELFLTLNMSKCPFNRQGEININLLKTSKNNAIRRYASMLISCNCRCLVDVPTRVRASSTTLIDYIINNDKMNPTASGALTTSDWSDHFGIFTIILEVTDKKKNSLQNKTTY